MFVQGWKKGGIEKKRVQAADVQPSGDTQSCVFAWIDICGFSVSAVLGHQFRATGLLVLNDP